MKTLPVRLTSLGAGIACLALALFTAQISAGAVIWTGASGTDTNWSDGGNWSGGTGTAGTPGGSDDVIFNMTGAGTTFGSISNVVDDTSGNFGGYVSSLSYTNNTGGSIQNTLIAPGVTLNLTNNTGPFGTALFVGTPTAAAANAAIVASIIGPGATLNVNNTNANISITQSGGNSSLGTLNMTNLDTFNANVYKIGIGDYFLGIGSIAAQGSLMLAKTNLIMTSWVGNYSTPYSVTLTNAIQLGEGSSSTLGGINAMFLGLTNAIFTDSIGVGGIKSGGSAGSPATIAFAPVFTNSSPALYVRGISGPNSRVTEWGVGDTAVSGNSSAQCYGKVDLSGGTVDIMVDTMILGRDRNFTSATAQANGVFTFTSGNVNVNSLTISFQGTSGTTSGVAVGVMNVKGTNANLAVNGNLELGHTTLTASPATLANGTLNIQNGSVAASNIIVGAVSITNNINMNNARLTVANAIATNANGLFLMTITNSVLGLTITDDSLKASIENLNTGGTSNLIQLASVPVFENYPMQFPLIKYTNFTGVGFNFGLTNVPDSAPGAFLSNNVANDSIDLYLPVSPAPVITDEPQPFSGAPGSAVTLGVTNTGNLPQTYQWYYTDSSTFTNALSDANPGPSGTSTITGSASDVLTIGNAQTGDGGGYFVVITNSYGATTSSIASVIISAGAIPPSISGLKDQTVIAGAIGTISASVSGAPVPTKQWQLNGTNLTDGLQADGSIVAGSTTTTLNITNVQYPSSQGTYSLIASNSALAVTNNMFLTVIVTPAITNQPASLVVTNGNSATFTVVAGGVPAPGYQWYKNSLANPIPTATGPSFTIASTSPSDTASYFVVVTNAAGSVTGSNVTLTVNSSMSAVSFGPADNATGVCYDTPLTIGFDQPPTLNALGTIKIYDVTNSSTPVDTLNLALGSPQSRNIGGTPFNSFPVIITGNTAVIYPHSGVLTSNQTYYVTIDDGVFTDSTGAYFAGINDSTTWKFTTKPTGPVDPVNPVVAADGSGDFVTVQGAVDSLPTAGPTRRVIHIQNGNYVEIVNVTKTNVTFRGQSRTGTVVGYANNNNMNPSTSTRMAFQVNAFEVAVENMTIINTTPQGGSQAEALMINGNGSHFILNNAEVDSRQDTILDNSATSSAYFNNSLIQGNFDYVWGGGVLFATNCEIRTIGGTGTPNLAAPRTANGASGNWQGYGGLMVSNGFSFVNCQLTRAAGVTNCLMSDHNGQTNGLAAWINCSIDLQAYTNADGTAQGSQLLWEYGCSNADNTVLLDNTASPFLSFVQLTSADPRLLAAENATTWLNGWTPQLAPNILTNPASQSIAGGQTATFTVGATGISDPTYQWQKNGTNIDGATNVTLNIINANVNDAASYSVIVSNAAGTVTSSAAVLTVGNTAPELRPIPTQIVNVGVPFSITNVAADPDEPIQSLTFSLLAGPGSLDSGTGILNWRPPVASAGSTNNVVIVATDNGSPNLSATNNFTIVVNPVAAPTSSTASFANGQFSMTVSGDAGPDYIIQVSTDLTDWQSILTNNAPTLPFTFTDTNSVNSAQFYRILLAP
ncbi:MAG TPA: pectinesterase family protein [Candidatus Angelobacter sp.]|nr:pectinesterase family protein [Candidatus Angelobacter sp.]